jgi:monothiol glutaredoxin
MSEGKKKVEEMVSSQNAFLFMKGTPAFPQCGFSARAVGVLKELGVEFGAFNILTDDEIRQGAKEYGEWPTFPQLYVGGELVGGSDIVMEMYENGELARLFASKES